jgi:hypothetical protein
MIRIGIHNHLFELLEPSMMLRHRSFGRRSSGPRILRHRNYLHRRILQH